MRFILEDLCLDTIVKEFARFNLAFTTTEDVNVKRLFEFLQRKYSFAILSRLYENFEVKDSYLDLLMNKHLKVLDTSWFRNCSWEKVSSKVAEIGSNTVTLLIKDELPPEIPTGILWQDTICHLPKLKFFSFHSGCQDKCLKNIATFCPDIENISVNRSRVTSDGVRSLCMVQNGKPCCAKLKKISIIKTDVQEDGVRYLLQNLRSLEVIYHKSFPFVLYSMHKDNLSSLDEVEPYNISTFDLRFLSNSSFTADTAKIFFSVCPRLKRLIHDLKEKEELSFFPKLPHLEKITISNYSPTKISFNDFFKSICEKLTYLWLYNFTVSLSVLAENCPVVKELYLIDTTILIQEELKFVFNSLYSITIECFSEESQNIRAFNLLTSSSPNFESLSFRESSLLSSEKKASILTCCKKCSITKLSFLFCEIEKDFIKDLLLNCQTLKNLDIIFCINYNDECDIIKFSKTLSHRVEVSEFMIDSRFSSRILR